MDSPRYQIGVIVAKHGKTSARHYDAALAGGVPITRTISHEEQDTVPRGAAFAILGFWVKPPGDPDPFGVPYLSPYYSWDLRPAAATNAPQPPAPSTLPEIANVVTTNSDYHPVYVSKEELNGQPTYHLELLPLRDSNKYRVRDVWMATDTHDPVQLITDGNFTTAPLTNVRWKITFRKFRAETRIDTEQTLESPKGYNLVQIVFFYLDDPRWAGKIGYRDGASTDEHRLPSLTEP